MNLVAYSQIIQRKSDMAADSESVKLSDRCEARKGDMSVDNEPWKRFIMDHKRYLLGKCSKMVLDVHEMLKYKYRPYDFATEKMEIPIESTWIMLYINDIPGIMDFNESLTSIFSFDSTIISDLYRMFESTQEEN